MTVAEELKLVKKELRAQRQLIYRLAYALCTHTRTDLAPDAALSSMEKIVVDARALLKKHKP